MTIRSISKMLSKVAHRTLVATLRLHGGHCLLHGLLIRVQAGSVKQKLPLLCGTICADAHSQVLAHDAAMNVWVPPHCGGTCPAGGVVHKRAAPSSRGSARSCRFAPCVYI